MAVRLGGAGRSICVPALVLHDGQLSVVQPLLATELVFMLVLRRFWVHQSIRVITWGAAGLICVGLAVFIVAGQPEGGQPTPASQHRLTAALACCAPAVLAVLAHQGSPGPARCSYASAAAVMWALVATFIKAFLVIIDPIVSITLSVWLFGQHFIASGAVLAVAAAAFAVV